VTEYAWIIDEDLISDGDDEGTKGPSDAPERMLDGLADGQGARFMMSDGDKTPYYMGRLIRWPIETPGGDELDDEDLFGPLDDFGLPNAGCSTIHYLDPHGNWVQP
jgi:hypothetical protein